MATLSSKLILSLIDRVTGPSRGIAGGLSRLSAQMTRMNRSQAAMLAPMRGFAGRLIAYGGAYIGVTEGIRGTVGAAVGFEEAFADVRKVVDASEGQFGEMRKQIIALSKELPNSAEGIAAIYAAAGQSNIPMAEFGKFAEMAAKVSVAWDTSEGETSDALAKIKTQLNMSVADIGLYADAINHLSNTTASKAPDLVDFSKRVAAQGEMFGFSAEQSLAYGSAMIAMGAETEVAATSFRNMGKALTRGAGTKKEAMRGWRRIGMDPKVVAKDMQKDAAKTTMMVMEAMQKVADHERPDIAMALFGEEARALMPVINNLTELKRQLGLISDEANYAGSAFREYDERAKTTANQLKIVKNNVRAIGIEIGDRMLPSLNSMLSETLNIMKTLGERVTIFDKIGTAIKGFLTGLGIDDGTFGDLGKSIKEFFFGVADGSKAADDLGRIFKRFEEFGASIRSVTDAIRESPLGDFLKSVSGYGVGLAIASFGISMIAGAVGRLAAMMYLLSGAKAAIGIIKLLAKGGKWAAAAAGIGATAAEVADAATGGGGKSKSKHPGGANTPTPLVSGKGGILKALGLTTVMAGWATLIQGLGDTPGDTFAEQVENQRKDREALQNLLGIKPEEETVTPSQGGPLTRGRKHKREPVMPFEDGDSITQRLKKFFFGAAAEDGFDFKEHFRINTGGPTQPMAPAIAPVVPPQGGTFNNMLKGMDKPQSSLPSPAQYAAEMQAVTLQTRATGVADVNVTNPQKPVMPVSVSVVVHNTSGDAAAIGAAVASQTGESVRAAVESAYTDGVA